ncbi:hypothetical protein CK203_001991 [Vitis vinifera]|uniref:Retrotransposon gag domain-containing protein n=1 Tax=Vitis vinifera TaxID=29760 RepID=A0A438KJM9_VITVI|nr:hypothetical protein CK203_001991 [Vitis vinifera]
MIAPMVQNVPPHRDPMVTPAMRNVHSHLAERPAGRKPPKRATHWLHQQKAGMTCSPRPFALISPITSPQEDFSYQSFPHTIGPTIPSITSCTIDSFMTLDIGNDALLCKVFPASLQGQALSWFHRLPPNSVDNFRDLSEAFVGQYLCSARHKQNISTLQNIKMKDNESLREFVKRFGQAVLQ